MSIDIKISNYIIHYIDKEAKKTVAEIDLSKNVRGEDEFSKSLVAEIHKSINDSPSLKNTSFKENSSNSFTLTLTDYLSTSHRKEFHAFSSSLQDLKDKMAKENLATGGYFLFADYSIQSKRFLIVVLLRKKAGINITKVGDTYVLNNSENINIDKIAMAFRLNFQIFDSNDKRNYLALITTQHNGVVSGYFRDWVNSGDIIKDEKNTENLVRLIKGIDPPLDEDGSAIYDSTNDFIKAVYDYARPRGSRVVNLRSMGMDFFNDENAFLNFAAKNNITIDPEFKRDATKWRSLVTIKAKVEGVELQVDYNKINDVDVVLRDNKVIINSKSLYDQISSQYKKEESKEE